MSALQFAFEGRLIVRSVRLDVNFENVVSVIKHSPKDDLAALCPATEASLLFYAVQRENDEEAEKLCRLLCDELKVCDPKQNDRNSQSALFFAARDGNARCVNYLISKGCNPNHRDSASQTALFYAARDGRRAVIETLLENNADINAVDHLGQTALFYASRDGRTETVTLMLDKGANIAVKDRQRRTALYYAQKNSHKELAAVLKAYGAGSGSTTPARQGSIDGYVSPHAVDADLTRPYKMARICSPDVSPQSSPNFTSSTPSKVPLCSNESAQPIRRQRYRLVMKGPSSDDPEIQWLSVPNENLCIFESLAPNVAVWPKDAPSPVTDVFYDLRPKWQAIALQILDELSTVEGGWIFSKPVDCKAWGCPDYYEVIKNPMDYTTMKKKMKDNQYRKAADFMAEMKLIFSNCFQYNKPESPVAAIGRNIESLFNNALVQHGLQKWLDREALIQDWYEDMSNVKDTKMENATNETQTSRVQENGSEMNGVENKVSVDADVRNTVLSGGPT